MGIERLGMNFGGRRSSGYGGEFDVSMLVHGAIPCDYIEFIRTADGGHPEVGSFKLPGGNEQNVLSVDVFYSWSDSHGRNIRQAMGVGATCWASRPCRLVRMVARTKFILIWQAAANRFGYTCMMRSKQE